MVATSFLQVNEFLVFKDRCAGSDTSRSPRSCFSFQRSASYFPKAALMSMSFRYLLFEYLKEDAERPASHSNAERWNEESEESVGTRRKHEESCPRSSLFAGSILRIEPVEFLWPIAHITLIIPASWKYSK